MKDNFTNNLEETFDNFYTKGAFLTVGDEEKANLIEKYSKYFGKESIEKTKDKIQKIFNDDLYY